MNLEYLFVAVLVLSKRFIIQYARYEHESESLILFLIHYGSYPSACIVSRCSVGVRQIITMHCMNDVNM
jgi:hypothetical protein